MFNTEHVIRLFHNLRPDIISYINLVDGMCFEQCEAALTKIRTVIASHSTNWTSERDEVLNEVYVLNRFVDLLGSYSTTWMNISESKFAGSWGSLQDSVGHLRSVKKFLNGNCTRIVDFFENQLIELEKL
jgi:hypothetical protein